MIIGLTGMIGMGKTTHAVSMMMNNFNGMFKTSDGSNRPIYYNHIRNLKARELKAHELSDEEVMSKPIHELVPAGSVVFMDECDYLYPVSAAGRDIPPYIKHLKEVRHHNITVIFITQDITMLHSYVRKLISPHIHIEKHMTGARIYEFNRAQAELSPTVFKLTPSSKYTIDEEAQKYFDSTITGNHVKVKRKLHWSLYVLPVLLGLLAWKGYGIYQRDLLTNLKKQLALRLFLRLTSKWQVTSCRLLFQVVLKPMISPKV